MPTQTPPGDLPERLREAADHAQPRGGDTADWLYEAAAEIERLQSALDRALAAGLVQADETRLRDGVQVLLDDLVRAYPDPSPFTTESTAIERLQVLLARPTTTEETH